jgi:hypothetical protein
MELGKEFGTAFSAQARVAHPLSVIGSRNEFGLGACRVLRWWTNLDQSHAGFELDLGFCAGLGLRSRNRNGCLLLLLGLLCGSLTLVALLVLGVPLAGFFGRQRLRVRCDSRDARFGARSGDGDIGGTIEVWIEVVESVHAVVLHEGFKVAVEEEVQQVRVFDFDKAIELLESCQ